MILKKLKDKYDLEYNQHSVVNFFGIGKPVLSYASKTGQEARKKILLLQTPVPVYNQAMDLINHRKFCLLVCH